MSELPAPARDRWQPLRCGLVDIYYYDEEEFHFRDGHLLLRGNNGTGKSKVLALTLPFLLDGQLAPSRVEPDGDPGKRMEWNLLLGGAYPDRQGYSWLEFGRRRDDGSEAFLTLGCGLRAVAGRGAPRSWYFVAEGRMGRELHLLDAGRRTLSKERLRAALEGRGQVMDTASAYRRAVDERLFHLGEERYEALINLLIQLRQPQLSKRPDERALSNALTQALPPLDQAVLNDLAESFRNLEAERAELAALELARESVRGFLDHYRQYARVAARRRARTVRRAESRYQATSAELAGAREALEQATEERERLSAGQNRLEAALEDARTEENSLRDSPAMRDARRLRELEALATERRDNLERATRGVENQRKRVQRYREDLQRREADLDHGLTELKRTQECWSDHARKAGIGATHRLVLEKLPSMEADAATAARAEELFAPAQSFVERLNAKRRADLEQLRRLNRSLAAAEQQETLARERRQQAAEDLEQLQEQRLETRELLAQRARELAGGYRGLLERTRELRLDDPEPLLEELLDWALTLEGDNPVRLALDQVYRQGIRNLEQARSRLEQEAREAQTRLDALEQEHRRLEAGEDRKPPPPHTLDPETRRKRAGAPLWQLADFRPDLDAESRAGLEAALEDSGLLDAWVMPDGRLLDPATWDRVLTLGPAAPDNLNRVLVPAVDPGDHLAAQVSGETIGRILAGIGWGESDHPHWVEASGCWRLGPARGQWGKARAEYLGRGAREAARRRRLTELEEQIGELTAALTGLRGNIGELERRRAELDREHGLIPGEERLRQTHAEAAALEQRLERQRSLLQRLETALDQARERVERHRTERDETAADLLLPTDAEGLELVEKALADYRASAGAYWPSLRRHWDNRRNLGETRQDLEEAGEHLEEQRLEQRRLEGEARVARVELETLRDTVGAEVEELNRGLAALAKRISALKQELESTRKQYDSALSLAARQGEKADHLAAQLQERDSQRREAVDALSLFAGEGLLATAVPDIEPLRREPPWPLDPAVRLARRMEQALGGVADGDDAWKRRQQQLLEHYQSLQSALAGYGHEAAAEQDGELLLVQVVFRGKPLRPLELAAQLDAEVGERTDLLTNKEKELLEEHLISDVAAHLQTMISDAERRLGAMNRELERRPTSTGMKLRLVWLPLEESEDAPAGLKDARERLLRQVADAWSPEDRSAVGEFLKRRIEQVRAADEGGSLLSHLERALDYRHWHRFSVERFQQGRWRPAYGPASGGERALVVTLPLFAAASGHYSSAVPEAPRLITLDEAFAGVDDDARAKCMGLLTQFDLDYMMTSEREWGCYPQVNGLAISHLVRHEGIEAVYVSRWLWDGRQRHKQEQPSPAKPDADPPRQGSLP